MYEARIEKDSISPDGVRLTTFVVTFPRIVLAEFNTHRVFSRNSASSRAIPVEKRILMVESNPFVPDTFGKNQKGMQAEDHIDDEGQRQARMAWKAACQSAVAHARTLQKLEVHKQLANRLLEPFCWHTVVVTATEWDNFFKLRCHKNAQPEIRKVAEMMRDLYYDTKEAKHEPKYGEWHLPFVDGYAYEEDPTCAGPLVDRMKMVSAGRCARVSYLTHDGKRDPAKDVELAQSLLKNGHMSPFEHIARPLTLQEKQWWRVKRDEGQDMPFCGNFRGWVQMRKEIPGEAVWKETEE
jgi:thymidylate synthase ThyX